MISFKQTTAIHLSPLWPSPDLLEEANSHHSRTTSKGSGPRYLCVQVRVDRRGEEGRGTDLSTKQGWYNTQERGCQQQHMVAAMAVVNHQPWGTAPTRVWPRQDHLCPSHTHIHVHPMSQPAIKHLKTLTGRNTRGFLLLSVVAALQRTSPTDLSMHAETAWGSWWLHGAATAMHAAAWSFSGEKQTRRDNVQLAHNILLKFQREK